MSASNTFETAMLQHYFQNAAHANVGDASGLQPSAAAGNFYIALFTADPTDTGGTSAECTYTGYARQAVVRSASGFTVSGNQVSNAAAITFPVATGGSETATHFAIMSASSGGTMHGSGALSPTLAISSGTQPEFPIGQLVATMD